MGFEHSTIEMGFFKHVYIPEALKVSPSCFGYKSHRGD